MSASARQRQRGVSPRELDTSTLRQAQQGNARAQHALVVRYQRPVFALVSRMLRPHDPRIEELAQETFLRVLAALPGFEPDAGARLSTWILTIATRLCLDTLRREQRRALALERDRLEGAADPGVVDDPERRVLARTLEQAVAALSPEQQAVLVLRTFHQLSYEEIGAALQLEAGTVKSRLSRARSRLRRLLGVSACGRGGAS